MLLSSTYPHFNWDPTKFTVPELWGNKKNHKKFMDWAAKQLNVKEMDDWYKVTEEVIHI